MLNTLMGLMNGSSFILGILEDRPTTISFVLGHDLVDQYGTF
jgi:hypothetical protein